MEKCIIWDPTSSLDKQGVGVFKRLFSNGHSGAPLPETYTWDRTGWYAVFGVWRLESVNLFSKVGFLGHWPSALYCYNILVLIRFQLVWVALGVGIIWLDGCFSERKRVFLSRRAKLVNTKPFVTHWFTLLFALCNFAFLLIISWLVFQGLFLDSPGEILTVIRRRPPPIDFYRRHCQA